MKTAKNIFLAIVIILFAIGMWPIAIPVAIIFIILAVISSKRQKKENQELKAENQRLQQELADQAVRHAMDKANHREKNN